jgi:hypothetical protein
VSPLLLPRPFEEENIMKRAIFAAILVGVLAAGADRTVSAAPDASAAARSARAEIVGTWRIDVPESDGGSPAFSALHTFNAGGTFVETSSNHAALAEGPAHGAWTVDHGRINLTFELFVFDGVKSVGVVRVRCVINLLAADTLEGRYVVDFIDPSGDVAEGIDSGTFTGTRVQVLPL